MSSPLSTAEVMDRLTRRALQVEDFLKACLTAPSIPERLRLAMRYSLLAGGKRLRPALCLSTAELCGLPGEKILPFAAALEFIHTYSLIHDDLPAMDDDDLRRGKPSCHRAFDEATAILAGDALLTDAFGLMASVGESTEEASGPAVPPARVITAIAELVRAAGSSGMVGGQMIDMECTGKSDVSSETLRHLDALKTGAMFRASCVTGGLLAGAAAPCVAALAGYGAALGAAFQIVDDILDATEDTATLGKPAGSDAQMSKTTYPALFGLEQSRELAREAALEAVARLDVFDVSSVRAQAEHAFLKALPPVLLKRIK